MKHMCVGYYQISLQVSLQRLPLDAHLTYMYVCYRHIHARMLLTHVRTHTYTSSSYGPAFHSNVCSSVVMFVLPLIPRSGQDMMPLWAHTAHIFLIRHTCILLLMRHTCILLLIRHTCILLLIRHTCILLLIRHTCILLLIRRTCILLLIRHTCILNEQKLWHLNAWFPPLFQG
jgi:hypothetical protein